LAPTLVTGAAGFAGTHLLLALARNASRGGIETRPDDLEITAWRRPAGGLSAGAPATKPLRRAPPDVDIGWQEVDMLNRDAVRHALAALRPRLVYHCAGVANVHGSWHNTLATLEANVLGTHALLEAVRSIDLRARILIPGSALVYKPSPRAITEEDAIGPVSPYGLSKLAQEVLARHFAEETGETILLARAFTHIGPGQDPSFAASSFARQVALIETGLAEPRLTVGNLSARRDLTDVRDTVEAYRLLVERGASARPYNVCSGQAYEIGEILDGLLTHACVTVRVEVDPQLLRPNDNPLLLGDPTRIRNEVGWRPQIPLGETLRDLLDYWRGVIRPPVGV
jgi:GDP-4-dehydro-6-deoxy-D-mannose reductase